MPQTRSKVSRGPESGNGKIKFLKTSKKRPGLTQSFGIRRTYNFGCNANTRYFKISARNSDGFGLLKKVKKLSLFFP